MATVKKCICSLYHNSDENYTPMKYPMTKKTALTLAILLLDAEASHSNHQDQKWANEAREAAMLLRDLRDKQGNFIKS